MKPVKEPTRAGNIVDGNAHPTPTPPPDAQKQAENIVDRVTRLIQNQDTTTYKSARDLAQRLANAGLLNTPTPDTTSAISRDALFDTIHDSIPELGIPHASLDGLYGEIACDIRDAIIENFPQIIQGPNTTQTP